MTYAEFLSGKARLARPRGITAGELHPKLFDWQRAIVGWSLQQGRAALFEDCGLGKTIQQLEWARHVPGKVLILAPLAVAQQTVGEGERFGIPVTYARSPVEAQITVTNYELLDRFDPSVYRGVVLDESSILKSFDGATRNALIEAFARTPYRLCCTATPAPNDYMELGNHAEFLGVMTRAEMLATFFVHDGGETQVWRLKRHAERDFWRWVCSWAVSVRNPSDIGYDGSAFSLPALRVHQTTVGVATATDTLFPMEALSLTERLAARRDSVSDRAAACAELVKSRRGAWVVWCHLNSEADALTALLPEAVEVRGSDSPDSKTQALTDFAAGKTRILVTKPSIAGFGMNWQHCHQMAFVGLSDSWEEYYQAIRRCWRFGQTKAVDVHCVVAETEGAVASNLRRKDADALAMAERMAEHTRDFVKYQLTHHEAPRMTAVDHRETATGDGWTMQLGDCVEAVTAMKAEAIDYTIFSPPFASLYTYTDSARDMGNCKNHDEFFEHFTYLVPQLLRVTRPGRLLSFHCMNLPTSKVRDGVIGITDFRGQLIRLFQEHGWIYHSEVVIWKDPVTAMQRTKALGLLHKTIRKDSAMSRQGIPDYLVTMRKPGENTKPIPHTAEEFPVARWQRYASPIWTDINPSDTLQYRSAREHADEKHIAPLQLTVIRRAMELWTAPDDLVLSPFAGIGSEGYIAVQLGRRFHGVELKQSYWKQACGNLKNAEHMQATLLTVKA